MTKLTDTQISVLASACQRADGIAIRPDALNRTAAVKVAAKLLAQSLVQEVPAKLGWPIWRMDEEGRAFSLKILKAGRALVQLNSPVSERAGKGDALQLAAEADASNGSALPAEGSPTPNAPGRKRDIVVALLQRESGVTLDELMAVTGWLPHSTRAALTGLRKTGLAITRNREPGSQASVYRIVSSAAAAA